MIKNVINNRINLKSRFAKREIIFGGWVSYREPAIAETLTKSGIDFLSIDMEHTTISIDDANRLITSVQCEGGVCVPRQVSHNNDYMKPLLEAGADGIMMPMVNSAEQVESILQDFKFPSKGKRSFGVNRAHGYGFDFEEYISTWNKSGIFIIQIESIQAVNNIESILEIDGIDAVMVGPYDISGSLDVPGDTSHPKVVEASRKVIKACENSQISCVTQIADVTPDSVEKALDQGFTSVILSSDLFILWKWAERAAKIMEKYR